MIYQATLLAFLLLADDAVEDRALIVEGVGNRVPLTTVAPDYPRKARRDRIEGEVQVCFEVDREGKTRRISVRKSTHRAFEKPSMEAVRDSTFRPLDDNEALPPTKSCRTFVFSLQPVERD